MADSVCTEVLCLKAIQICSVYIPYKDKSQMSIANCCYSYCSLQHLSWTWQCV